MDESSREIEHPDPDELGLWCIDDPGFLDELDRRVNDGTPGIPWEEVREMLRRQLDPPKPPST